MIRIKKLLLLFIGLHFSVLGFSQSRNYDSLRTELSRTTDDLKRFDLLNNILLDVTSFRGDNLDSLATLEMLSIAQKLNNDSLKAISYNWLGSYFFQMKGDNTSALEYYFKALPLAENTKEKRRISSIYFDMALVYFNMKDNERALEATRKGGENLPDKEHPLYYFMLYQYQANMAEYFLDLKNVDSASYYNEISSKTIVHFDNSPSYLFTDYTNRAVTNALANNIDKADDYFNRAIILQDSMKNLSSKLYFYKFYLSFLLSQNRSKIGILESKKLLKIGADNSNNNMKLTAAQYLRQFYDAQNQTDSAYYFSRMEAQINADMSSQDNKSRMESLLLNDQLRRIEEKNRIEVYQNQLKQYVLLAGLGMVLIIALILFRNMREKQKTNTILEKTLSDLKSTQTQLIHAEKMASLGELTAGIAHEIQNPLNFVNNFSELSSELLDEMNMEIEKGDLEEVKVIAVDVKKNLEKIAHHGKRAEGIVKGMLQHSRSSSGVKEPTDINALCDEYLRLAYHGLRAKDQSFNAKLITEFDSSIGEINIMSQEMGRVLLNLITNAFHAIRERKAQEGDSFEPKIRITSKKETNLVIINVVDNGFGIPENIKEKIFQPFFTTKPTGQGTGLGLSMSYDIVTKGHGGELKMESILNQGSTFSVELPIHF